MSLKKQIIGELMFTLSKQIKKINKKKFLILNKKNIIYDEINANKFANSDEYLKNKKTITISQAGYYGFYLLGVCMYIKEHYNTDNCIFSGASAGALCSLFMTIKNNPKKMMDLIVVNENYKNKNAIEMLQITKKIIFTNFSEKDFELNSLFITVNTINQTNIYTDFENFEDVLNCCEASSHIPYISGPKTLEYKDKFVFDGGFCKNPYLDSLQQILHIHPNIWGQNAKIPFILYKTNPVDFEKLYERGYQDTLKFGKETLDKLFTPLSV
jgi:hypothetical protein